MVTVKEEVVAVVVVVERREKIVTMRFDSQRLRI